MNLREFKKASALIIVGLFFAIPLTIAQASEFSNNNQISNQVSSETEIKIPVLSEGESYSQTINNSDGQEGKVIVEFLEEDLSPQLAWYWTGGGWGMLKNGTYSIRVVYGIANAGFKVNVKDKNITRAYDPWWFNLIGTTGNLSKYGNKQATLNMQFNMSIPWINGPSWTGGVRAQINNNRDLLIYAR